MASDQAAWNAFVATARNATFLHDRRFMDYHSHRFTEGSWIAEQDGAILAVLPANRDGDLLISHGGLTYGGWLLGTRATTAAVLGLFRSWLNALLETGVSRVCYKVVPHVYHRSPAEEDLYALFRIGASLARREVSTALDLGAPLPMNENRRRNLRLSQKQGIQVLLSEDWETYHALLSETLSTRHGVAPVHSLEELRTLHRAFPEQVRLYAAHAPGGTMVAGLVLFDTDTAAHTQYLASGLEGRKQGALDALVARVIAESRPRRRWLTLGISTDLGGRVLNEGLIHQKESFGGRAVVHDTYEFEVASACATLGVAW
jgi:hypothetical protein